MKKGLLTGLLLFGIFFGAGNLIFPPALGVSAGENFWPAILGFVVSGVGIAIVTLIVGALNPNGYGAEMDEKNITIILNNILSFTLFINWTTFCDSKNCSDCILILE